MCKSHARACCPAGLGFQCTRVEEPLKVRRLRRDDGCAWYAAAAA
jgi:hypothetical protein